MRQALRSAFIRESQEAVRQEVMGRLLKEASELAMPDPDETQWNLTSSGNFLIGGEVKKELDDADYRKLRAVANRGYHKNPHVRSIISNLVKFVIGKGASEPILRGLSDRDQEKVLEVWKVFAKRNRWRRKQQEIARRCFRDGEAFIRYRNLGTDTESDIDTLIHFIEPDFIRSNDSLISHGIETESDDVSMVKSYRFVGPASMDEDILTLEEIQHIKIGVDENVKRGRTVLEPVLPDITNFGRFKESRTILNILRSNMVMVEKMPGGATRINQKLEGFQATKHGDTRGTNRQKMLKPGSKITANPDYDLEFKTPNLGSGEAEIDGRMLLLSVAAGVSLPEFVVSADAKNNNFASIDKAIITAIKEVEIWQEFFKEEFCEIFDRAMRPVFDVKDFDCDFEFEPFDVRDLLQEAQVGNILRLNGVISKQSLAAKFGLDFREELKEIEKEKELEGMNFNLGEEE